MIGLEKMRDIDPSLKDKSDTEVLEIRAKLYALAQLAFDVRMKKQAKKSSVSKNPRGS